MFYETKNSINYDSFNIEAGRDFSFPLHLHANFEIITVIEGEMTVTVDKMKYILSPGKAVMIFPNQAHSLLTDSHSEHILCIFSPKLISAYSGVFLNSLPDSHLFSPDSFYLNRLFELRESRDTLSVKGLLYSLCAEFDQTATYHERDTGKEDLLLRIFKFVENNYLHSCTLNDLSESIAYHGVYLSRYFKDCTGISFTDFVTRHRVEEAAYSIKNSQKKIVDIAYESGFDSLRSFNRNFKRIMGKTPSEYRDSAI